MSEATPRPWKRRNSISAVISGPRGERVGVIDKESDCAIVLRAVNHEKRLRSACEKALAWFHTAGYPEASVVKVLSDVLNKT